MINKCPKLVDVVKSPVILDFMNDEIDMMVKCTIKFDLLSKLCESLAQYLLPLDNRKGRFEKMDKRIKQIMETHDMLILIYELLKEIDEEISLNEKKTVKYILTQLLRNLMTKMVTNI